MGRSQDLCVWMHIPGRPGGLHSIPAWGPAAFVHNAAVYTPPPITPLMWRQFHTEQDFIWLGVYLLKYALLPSWRYKPPEQPRQCFIARTEGRRVAKHPAQVRVERGSLSQVSRHLPNTAKATPTLSHIPQLVCNREDICFYLSHERGPRGVVDPAILTGTKGDVALVAHEAAEGVGAADACRVPVHLVPPAAATKTSPMATPLGNGVIQLLLQAPATVLAQLGHPGAEAAVLGGDPQEKIPM